MSVYSRTLKHVNHKDFRRTHQRHLGEQEVLRKIERQKNLKEKKEIKEIKKLSSPFKSNWREELKIAQNQREEVVEDSINKEYDWRKQVTSDKKKYFEEGMTTSDMFLTTLPAYGDTNLESPPWSVFDGYQYSVSGGTLTLSGNPDPYPTNTAFSTFNTSQYDTLVFDVSVGAGSGFALFDVPATGPYLITSTSGTYSVTLPASQSLGLAFLANGNGNVTISNLRFQRRTPMNVFVSLDSPEATAFIRTDPNLSNLSPKEKQQKLKEMLQASDEYVMKMLGSNFPGTGAVPPGESGDTPGVEIANYQKELSKYQKDLAAYEKYTAASKKESERLSKAVDVARAEYLKPGQTVAQRQQSLQKLQAAIKAGTDHASFGLRNPDKVPIKPTPPTLQTKSQLTPQQLANIDKQIKQLKKDNEQIKADANRRNWELAAQIGMDALTAAALLSPIPGDEAIVAGALAVKTGAGSAGARAFAKVNPGKYNPFLSDRVNRYFRNSYEPQGQLISEKRKLKSPEEVLNKIPGYYDGKPAPLGFPVEPPPKMVNGMHPDLVDGKKVADRFNRLDSQSAQAMPLTGNPHIDKKVLKARKQPK